MLRVNRIHLMTAVCALFCSSAALGQIKVAIVNTQKAILDTAEIQKEQTAMEAKFKPKQDALQKLQKELQDIQEQLQKMQGKLSPDAERDLSAKGRRVQTDLQRSQEDLQASVENHRNDVLQRVGRQMQGVVQKLAEEKGLDIVIDSGNTVYFKPVFEITAEATAAYDKTFPAK